MTARAIEATVIMARSSEDGERKSNDEVDQAARAVATAIRAPATSDRSTSDADRTRVDLDVELENLADDGNGGGRMRIDMPRER
jgi:hypothetical protein